MSYVVEINADNFQAEVLGATVPVLVDFYGSTCPPCQAMLPVIDALAADLGGDVKIAKANVRDNEALAVQYRVAAVPTFIIFRDGQEIGRLRGLQSKAALLEALGLRG